jgi:uncharacterized protein YndB with AHSA1/START domain
MAQGKITVSTPSDLEIVMTRVFNAPRHLVYEAHSKPEHIQRWWGPGASTMISCELDFRPGGRWRFVSREPDGSESAFRGEIRELVEPEKIVWTFEWEGMPGHISVETLTLEESDGKTTVTARAVYDNKQDRDGMLQSGMEEGAVETYERLDEYLEKLKSRAAS